MPANKYALLRYRIIDDCLTNKGRKFPTKEDLPEYVFVEHVYIDKLNDLKFKKYGFDNIKVGELKTGKCKFKVFENPLSTK